MRHSLTSYCVCFVYAFVGLFVFFQVEGKSFTAIGGAAKQQPKTAAGKVKPNDPCPCNSGKKAKKCCSDPSKK